MIIILALAACISGILISFYIYKKKSRHQKLACPRDTPCDAVIHSHYSKTLGIPNEVLGIIYFSVVAIIICIPNFLSQYTNILAVILIVGFLFTLYLIILQAFVLRVWCLWCLGITISNLVLIGSLATLFFPIKNI